MFPCKNLDAIERHNFVLQNYVLNKARSKEKRDSDVIKENHKFLWNEEDEAASSTWEERLAKKYYDKLFKEYCISDLTYYKENKIALRWRIEKEVVLGKGQFICGNRKCEEKEQLRSWEVNFAYTEHGEKKNALIKLRLCPPCSEKLNYRSKKREIRRLKFVEKTRGKDEHKDSQKHKKKRKRSSKSQSPEMNRVSDEEDKDSPEKEVEEAEDVFGNVWEGKDKTAEQVVREDEFGKYLEDLLL